MTILDTKTDLTDSAAVAMLVKVWVGTELFKNKSVQGARAAAAAAAILGPLDTMACGVTKESTGDALIAESSRVARREVKILFQRAGRVF